MQLGRARRSAHIVGSVACAEEFLRPGGLAAKVYPGPIPPEGPGWRVKAPRTDIPWTLVATPRISYLRRVVVPNVATPCARCTSSATHSLQRVRSMRGL